MARNNHTSDLFAVDPTLEFGLIRHPHVRVKLVGEDGNAFAILGRVTRAMRKAGVSKEERDLFMQEATAGDYNQLLGTVMRWVNVE
jgi:hypothetical protein